MPTSKILKFSLEIFAVISGSNPNLFSFNFIFFNMVDLNALNPTSISVRLILVSVLDKKVNK
jgi:hypothetical protein